MTGRLVTRLSVAAASTFAAVALWATPALAGDLTTRYAVADAQPAAAAGDDDLARQIEQAEERLREADPDAAADRDTERRIAADQRDIKDGLASGDSAQVRRAVEDEQAIAAAERAAEEGDSEAA
ncbi:hypothetical protein BX285_6185 [Streptomyces sp. 1114.5]|uniref:hypothetical protein n=1 Tax=Streptomyces sp. 1114.5 TaxID=1938830 RepID=UPI000EAD7F45|nr:hypothetical protein [Streptomyces sp. 1114.5]RKT12218.1 hypothetical protein BX285_6185 [Streptomyces sp. 1114.5]